MLGVVVGLHVGKTGHNVSQKTSGSETTFVRSKFVKIVQRDPLGDLCGCSKNQKRLWILSERLVLS